MKRILPEIFNMFIYVGEINFKEPYVVRCEVEGQVKDTPITSFEEAEKVVQDNFKNEWNFWELERIISWIGEHDQAYKDFLYHFGLLSEKEFNSEEELDNKWMEFGAKDFLNETGKTLEDVYNWIGEHEYLAEDFEIHFKEN